jgi:large subunit ribosomal protein L30
LKDSKFKVMAKIKITQSKSVIKANNRQKLTIRALGLRNPHDVVELESTPQILGMVNKVKHLVQVEKI